MSKEINKVVTFGEIMLRLSSPDSLRISQTNSFNEIDLEELKKGLEKAKGFIRKKLSQNLNLRRIPEIFFKIEEFI